MRLKPLPFNIRTVTVLATSFGLYVVLSWRLMAGLPVDVHSLTTFSALLVLAGTLALLFGRAFVAGIFYLLVGAGGTAAAWDRWSLSTGHWNKIQALFSGTPITRDEAEMLMFHTPFLIIGLLLIIVFREKTRAI